VPGQTSFEQALDGLMSYGPTFPASFRRAADFVDKILRGAKPAESSNRPDLIWSWI
jgi:hypothetical protein